MYVLNYSNFKLADALRGFDQCQTVEQYSHYLDYLRVLAMVFGDPEIRDNWPAISERAGDTVEQFKPRVVH